MIKAAKKIATFPLFGLLAACSSVWEEIRYIPATSEGWQVESDTIQNITVNKGTLIAKYYCENLVLLVPQFSLVKNAFWGPPIIPIIPNLEKQDPILSIEIRGAKKQASCPQIRIDKNMVKGEKRLAELSWQDSKMLCDYEFTASQDFYLDIVGIDKGVVCPHEPLKFQKFSGWRYRPFVMPRT